MESLRQDIRYTLRGMRRQPGFFLTAVLSLALGMGVNTAIFSAADALFWKPLPVRDPQRTVYIFHTSPGSADQGTSFRAFEEYRRRTDLFAAAAAFTGARPMQAGDSAQRQTVYAGPVSSDFFSVADVTLPRGRAFDGRADASGDPDYVVVLSHRGWTRLFAADPLIVGRTVVLNDRPFTIVGVAPAGFAGLDPEAAVDLWMPLRTWAHVVSEPGRLTGDEHWLTMLATLRPGVTREQAQSALATMTDVRARKDQRVALRSVQDRTAALGDAAMIGAAAFAAGAFVLLLAWTNVASLMIARAAARQREMAIRAAVGASRMQLVRLWLVETGTIASVACAAAIVLAFWMLEAAVAVELPTGIGHADAPMPALEFDLDVRVLTFAIALSIVSSLAISLLSAVRVTSARTIPASADRDDRRFLPGFNLRSAVLACQLMLSVMLLIPCGLLVRSGLNVATLDPGFSADGVLLLPISRDQSGVRVQKPPDFDTHLIARVAELPTVQAVTAMDPVPLWFGGNFAFFAAGGADAQRFGFSRVAPGYFRTLRLPLVRGRDFTAGDNASAPAVAIVNETLARRFFPGGQALGGAITHGKDSIEIVGIAGDAKYLSLAEPPQPWIYLPLRQDPTENAGLSLAVRIGRDSPEVRQRIEREVRALVPNWPHFRFRRLDEGLELQRMIPRTGAAVLGVLGAFALLLAAVGIYGVSAYVVAARTREMGIRLALGAHPRRVTALVIGEVMRVCVPGALLGIGLAFAATRIMGALLVATSPGDPVTFLLVPIGLTAVAIFASYLPARHSGRTNPLAVLRAE